MTASKSLPVRPSLESLRKQAKKLARERSIPLRDAQLVLAREYGFAGWRDLLAEVNKRLGAGLEWAAAEARRVIHDNDVARLKQLLIDYPALLAWHADADNAGLLGFATGAYGDAFGEERERWFTRAASAELLIDAGAVVMPAVCDGLVQSRARGLLQLFQRKGLLPRTLKFFAALGDLEAVRATLENGADDLETINDAFIRACAFEHEPIASILLDRSIALDPELGAHVDRGPGRQEFVRYFIEKKPDGTERLGLWKAFVVEQIRRAAQEGDLAAFAHGLERESWLLDEAGEDFQAGLISWAALNGRGDVIAALLDREPALLRRQPPPHSQAIEFALTYAHADLLPLITRIWPLPDDLPHAAGTGNLPRVKQWFDEAGAPALGDPARHDPYNDVRIWNDLHWHAPSEQHVLDVALAYAVINRHFDVADFLLGHGADINTDWNSHEPASILHHLVFLDDYEAMRFLIDRGIDLTITDYRWSSNAIGWARYGKQDEKMAQWLEAADRARATRP